MSAAVLRRIVRFVSSLILAALALCLLSTVTPSHARSMFWSESRFWWGDFRHRYPPRRPKSDLTKKQPQDASKGPLQIIVSIADQRISLYENGILIAQSSVSTGVERHPTPLGVFSVISRHKWHRSNIYSGAPMPYMQRITWSGIALHAGELPGYPAFKAGHAGDHRPRGCPASRDRPHATFCAQDSSCVRCAGRRHRDTCKQ
jgi:hypothetical protein